MTNSELRKKEEAIANKLFKLMEDSKDKQDSENTEAITVNVSSIETECEELLKGYD